MTCTSTRILATMHLSNERHDQERNDVDDFDKGVDGGACCVLVRIAHGVASDGCFMRVRAFAAVMAVFNVFLGVVLCTAAGTHGDRNEEAGDDGAHEQAA